MKNNKSPKDQTNENDLKRILKRLEKQKGSTELQLTDQQSQQLARAIKKMLKKHLH